MTPKLTKAQAGSIGGRRTLELYGASFFSKIGKLGAAALHDKYRISVVGNSHHALVDRETNIIKAFLTTREERVLRFGKG